MKLENSQRIFERMCRCIPGGVNSPVRSFSAVGLPPVVAKSAHGCYLTDEDGNTYIDYIGSWGPLIFGHSPDFLTEGLTEIARNGISYGLTSLAEGEMAELVSAMYPAAELVRMVNSGTEAAMSAIRVARGYTRREKILKFEGCYHGHSDMLLASAGSGILTCGIPSTCGVPASAVSNTLVCPYNDIPALERIFESQGADLACVILEPVAGNMGLIPAKPEFLSALRRLTKAYGAVLIFDEVISGFRAAPGGAAEVYGIQPDLACFGKIIGAGMPVGAYAGRREIMHMAAPVGPVYQAGTLSGNPLAMELGKRCLSRLRSQPEIYQELAGKARFLAQAFRENLKRLGLPYTVVQYGSLLCLFFTGKTPVCYSDAALCDIKKFQVYYRAMLEQGVLLPPSQFECMFLSLAHRQADLERTAQANYHALEELKASAL